MNIGLQQSEALGNDIVFTAKCYIKYIKHKILAFLLILLIPVFTLSAIYMGIIIAGVNSVMFIYLGILSILSFIPFGLGLGALYDVMYGKQDYFSHNSIHIISYAIYTMTVNEVFLLIYASHVIFDFSEYFLWAVPVNVAFGWMYSIIYYFANISTAKAGVDKKLEMEAKYERKLFDKTRTITGNIASQSKHKHCLGELNKKVKQEISAEDIRKTSINRREQFQRDIKLLKKRQSLKITRKIALHKKTISSTSNTPNHYHQRLYTPQEDTCFTSAEAKLNHDMELAEYNKAFYGDSKEISYRISSLADIAIEKYEVKQTIKLEIAEILNNRATFTNIYKLQKILGNKHNYTFPKWYLTEILESGIFTKELHYKEGIKMGYFGLKEWEKE